MAVLQTIPRTPEQSDKQTRLALDMIITMLNSLVRSGALVQTGAQDWALVSSVGITLAGLSVLGRAGNTSGTPAAITASSDKQVLRRSGTSIGFGAIDLSSSNAVSGDLAFANLTQGSALSVLGVTGNSTADVASIVAASDFQVLRRSGTAVGFGAVNLASSNAVTGRLPYANITAATAASKLFGRESGSAGDWEEITLGTNLSMSGSTLNATGGSSTTGTNAENVLTTYSISATSGTYVNTGVSQLTLPAIGTYRVWANLRVNMISLIASSFIGCRLYDTTNSAAIANSERLLIFDGATLNEQLTIGVEWLVTTAGTNVALDLSLVRNGTFTSSDITSNSDGRSTFGYIRLS